MSTLPDGPLIAWYGDDFTGAAACLEVMAFAGIEAVLFLDIPTDAQRARFTSAEAIGVAGVARSQSPNWMRTHLPAIFDFLAGIGAPLVQYKVCSTFDSSPEVGSLGCAVDIAAERFGGAWVPMLVAAPAIGRWQAFGNLFATGPGGRYRLDRHPVMRDHPVTPMAEADLGRHLAAQTARAVGLVDLVAMKGDAESALDAARMAGAEIVSLDCVDKETLAIAGRLIWERRGDAPFVVGSQGVQYALVEHWRSMGLSPAPPPKGAGHAARIVAISGSVSTVTAAQIDHALADGFEAVAFDAASVTDEAACFRAEDAAVDAALAVLAQNCAPLILAAKGPDDPAISRFMHAVDGSGMRTDAARERIGAALGRILERVLRRAGPARAIISGGDTSGHATRQLGIHALTALAPTLPGAALMKAHSDDPAFDGLELALKGGQMGGTDYFSAIRNGGGTS